MARTKQQLADDRDAWFKERSDDLEAGRYKASRLIPTLDRDVMVSLATTAAYDVFFGRKTITDAVIQKARNAAFKAVQYSDPGAGTSEHPHAAYSHGVAALAQEGVIDALKRWEQYRKKNKR